MKKYFLSLVVCFILTMPAWAQGNTAVLFEGVVLAGNPRFIDDKEGFKTLEAKNPVFPGVEIRFNQGGRVTVGIGYQRWELEGAAETVVTMENPRAAYSFDRSDSINQILGTIYFNFLIEGKARPFIGGGAGIAQVQTTHRIFNKVEPPGFRFDLPDSFSEDSTKVAVKVVGGVNIFPTKHLLISLAGGYVNGAALSFGAGVTF